MATRGVQLSEAVIQAERNVTVVQRFQPFSKAYQKLVYCETVSDSFPPFPVPDFHLPYAFKQDQGNSGVMASVAAQIGGSLR